MYTSVEHAACCCCCCCNVVLVVIRRVGFTEKHKYFLCSFIYCWNKVKDNLFQTTCTDTEVDYCYYERKWYM